jgi:hypothetical protein
MPENHLSEVAAFQVFLSGRVCVFGDTNAVWRFGRLFLRCPRCDRLATRIYVPTAESWAACRQCWGLTYESRQQRNYKGGGMFAYAGITSRAVAECTTLSDRERRAEASAERYAERRSILGPTAGGRR